MEAVARGQRSPAGLLAAAGCFLLPVAYSPSVYSPFWSPKAAVLLVLGGAGLALLPGLWRSSSGVRAPAMAATTFAALAMLSTLLSPAPVNALTGLYHWGTGLVFVLALVGCWALGVGVPEPDRPLVLGALLAGITVSGVVAVLQVLVSIGVPSLDQSGRAAGLAGNPVHLGTLMAGGAAILVWQGRRSWRWAATLVAPAMVVQLSGTRFALAVLLGAVAVGAVSTLFLDARAGSARTSVQRWGAAAVLVVATVLGIGAGALVAQVGDVQTAVDRAAGPGGSASVLGGGGVRVRLEVWQYATEAVADRPVLGHGPGRFRAATSADRTLRVAQMEGGDVIYTDAHNLFVEHAVTTGLLAVVALVCWLVLAGRVSSGPFLWFAVAALAMAMVQPSNVQTTPLLFLGLGLATTAVAPGRATPGVAVGGLVGLVVAGALVLGDARLEQTRLDLELADARAADSLLRPWPEPATLRARSHSFLALSRESTDALTIRWRREAVRRDQTDPALRILLGDELAANGSQDSAAQQYEMALRHNPYSVAALSRLARSAQERGEVDRARALLVRALAVRPLPRLERRLRELS